MVEPGSSVDKPDMEVQSKSSFVLSRIIKAHRGDVKGILQTNDGTIVTASRDGSIKSWISHDDQYSQSKTHTTMQPSNLSIGAIAVYNVLDKCLLFVARRDGSIAVFTADGTEPTQILKSHDQNVCSLHVDPTNMILMSGSWDSKAVVWSINEILNETPLNPRVLSGHKMSVWAVTTVMDKPGLYLTGSADLTIKLWSEQTQLHTFEGHRDVVRCIVTISPSKFLSASNDSTIRLWDVVDYSCLRCYSSSPNEYIYSMSLLPTGSTSMLMNCGEKGFIEIWNVEQTGGNLRHLDLFYTPTQSIWCLCTLQNGDIAAGADNGNVYIFTRDAQRKATKAVLDVFEADIAKKAEQRVEAMRRAVQDIVKITVELEDGQNLILSYTKGTNPVDAAQAFIMENHLPPAYLDKIVDYIKVNIPESRNVNVTSQPRQSELNGEKKWDYSFDVTTEDGRVMKLQCNAGEDLNWVAQRFLEQYNLPISFLPKVSALLQTQLPSSSTTSQSSNIFADPFTGVNRYVPNTASAISASAMETDPLTGQGRYIPSSTSTSNSTIVPNASLPHDMKRPRGDLVPLREYFRFGIEQASSKAIIKLVELNNLQSDYRLTEAQVKALEEVFTQPVYEVTDVHVSALNTGLQWNIDTMLPIMDAFRLALLNQHINSIYCAMRSEDENEPKGVQTMKKLSAILIGSSSEALHILACRAVANAANHECGRQMLLDDLSTLVSVLLMHFSGNKASLQIAAASALANLALLLLKNTECDRMTELGPREDMCVLIIKALEETKDFSRFSGIAQIRLLQAIVTLMWGDDTLIRIAKSRNIAVIVNRMKDAVLDEAAKIIARDIVEMTYAV